VPAYALQKPTTPQNKEPSLTSLFFKTEGSKKSMKLSVVCWLPASLYRGQNVKYAWRFIKAGTSKANVK